MKTQTEFLLAKSLQMIEQQKIIEIQRQQIAMQADEIDLLKARLNFVELKLMREAEINSDITMPLQDCMFFRKQAT